MTEPTLLCDIQDGVATITLNRPDRLNAIDRTMGELLDRTMAQVGSDPAVKVIVLTGAGRGFCAGGDVGRLEDLTQDHGASLDPVGPNGYQTVFEPLKDAPPELRQRYIITAAMPQPVIAAVNGPCAGVGLSLAVNADIRFASTSALFAAGFSRRGLTCEAGLAYTLPRIVGHGNAAELFFSGRKVSAEEALQIGLVSKLLEPDALMPFVQAYARDMATNVSPRSIRIAKRQMRLAWEQTYAQALDLSHQEALASFSTDDFREGVAALKEKRTPVFTGR